MIDGSGFRQGRHAVRFPPSLGRLGGRAAERSGRGRSPCRAHGAGAWAMTSADGAVRGRQPGDRRHQRRDRRSGCCRICRAAALRRHSGRAERHGGRGADDPGVPLQRGARRAARRGAAAGPGHQRHRGAPPAPIWRRRRGPVVRFHRRVRIRAMAASRGRGCCWPLRARNRAGPGAGGRWWATAAHDLVAGRAAGMRAVAVLTGIAGRGLSCPAGRCGPARHWPSGRTGSTRAAPAEQRAAKNDTICVVKRCPIAARRFGSNLRAQSRAARKGADDDR